MCIYDLIHNMFLLKSIADSNFCICQFMNHANFAPFLFALVSQFGAVDAAVCLAFAEETITYMYT